MAPLRALPKKSIFFLWDEEDLQPSNTSTLSRWDRQHLQAVRDEWRVIVWLP